MAVKKVEEARQCPACGGKMVRETRRRLIRYKKLSAEIDQPAWWCADCGEGVLDAQDSAIADRAFATLKARAEDVLGPEAVAKIRKRLKLTQRAAGRILGGGARAFQRYEAGTVVVSQPMNNLLVLLNREPRRLAELTAHSAKEAKVTKRPNRQS
jgi:HTH-type transcriptional regulator / antitoxin MqsA